MNNVLVRELSVDVSAENPIDIEAGTVRAFVSSNQVDSHRSIVLQSGMDMTQYRRNPILCWGHPLSSLCEEPGPERLIGKAVHIDRGDDLTRMKFQFARQENPTAKLAFDLFAGGFLRMFSIGARIIEEVTAKSDDDLLEALPDFALAALLEGRADVVYTKSELIEVSAVFAGSNRLAMVASQKGASEMFNRELCERADKAIDRVNSTLDRMEAVAQKLERQADSLQPVELEVKTAEPVFDREELRQIVLDVLGEVMS